MQISSQFQTTFGMAYKHSSTSVDGVVKSFETPQEIRAYQNGANKLNKYSNKKKMNVEAALSNGDTLTLTIVDKKGREIKTEPYEIKIESFTTKKGFNALYKGLKSDMNAEFARLKSLDKVLKKHGNKGTTSKPQGK